MQIRWTRALASVIAALSEDEAQTADVHNRAREMGAVQPGAPVDGARVSVVSAFRQRLAPSPAASAFEEAWRDVYQAGTPLGYVASSVDRHIIRKAVSDILAAGHSISVYDGGEGFAVYRSRTTSEILEAMAQTDSDALHIYDANGAKIGWVSFVYGNEPGVVLADYSANAATEALLAGANAIAAKS